MRLVARDDVSSVGRIDNVQVVLGRHAPDAVAATTFGGLLLDMARRYPKGMGLIIVLQATATPRPDARAALVSGFQQAWQNMHAVLFVVEAGGFQAAVQRSVMGAIMLAVQLRSRVKTVATLEEGLPWFIETLNGSAPARGAAQALGASIRSFCEAESQPALTPVAFDRHLSR